VRAADGKTPGARSESAEPPWGDAGREVLDAAERRVAASDYPGAVLDAFPRVMVDVERSYGVRFPRHWTGRDVVAHGLRSDTGSLPDLLVRLYELYEPVRYGTAHDRTPGELIPLLRELYARTALRALPAARPGPRPGRRAPSGGSPGPGGGSGGPDG